MDEQESDVEDFPDDVSESAAFTPGTGPASPRAREPLRESWWVVALDALRTERRHQVMACVLVALVVGAFALWPRDHGSTPLGQIRRHPERWDNRIVTVAGRVGEVFPVGGGYAFYLHQGRDTLVVFTRSRTPVSRERVSVRGSISTGFLDGVPRQALFEQI